MPGIFRAPARVLQQLLRTFATLWTMLVRLLGQDHAVLGYRYAVSLIDRDQVGIEGIGLVCYEYDRPVTAATRTFRLAVNTQVIVFK